MAKETSGVAEQVRRMAEGSPLEEGWCLDFDRPEPVYECSELEGRVAMGEVSLSYDGTKVLDVKTGKLSEGEPIDRRGIPVTLMESLATTRANEAGVPSADGDAVTTGNALAGGRGGGRAGGRP